MTRYLYPLIILISLFLASCSEAKDIPKNTVESSENIEQDDNLINDDIENNIAINEAVESEAKSIKEAAAEAVRIIEEEAQVEIDAIEPSPETITEDDAE